MEPGSNNGTCRILPTINWGKVQYFQTEEGRKTVMLGPKTKDNELLLLCKQLDALSTNMSDEMEP